MIGRKSACDRKEKKMTLGMYIRNTPAGGARKGR
jgi:hypothetical protein